MIFANLITQLGITYYVMTNAKVTETDKNNLKHWVLTISTFIIIVILLIVIKNKKPPLFLGGLLLFFYLLFRRSRF